MVTIVPGFVIYVGVLWQIERKIAARQEFYARVFVIRRNKFHEVKRKTKVKNTITHDFNPISLGTLHFGFALSLWSIWATTQVGDIGTFMIAIIVSLTSLAFFVAVYYKRFWDLFYRQAALLVIGLSFIALSAGFIFGIFESLPAFPQTTLTNRIIVQIVIYFGFAWIVTILLAMVRDAGNKLVQFLILVFLIFFGVAKVTNTDLISKIGGIVLFAILCLATSYP